MSVSTAVCDSLALSIPAPLLPLVLIHGDNEIVRRGEIAGRIYGHQDDRILAHFRRAIARALRA